MKQNLLSSSSLPDAGLTYYESPGIDLRQPNNVDPKLRLEHAKARVVLAIEMTQTLWRKAVTDARSAFRAAKADLKRAVRESKIARSRFESVRRPDLFALGLALVFGILAVAAEYYLSLTTIGPAFGVEPQSVPGYFLAAIPLVVVAACHRPAEKVFALVRRINRSNGVSRKILAVTLDILLASGIVFANYKMIASLAPLRQQVAIILSGTADQTKLVAAEPAGSAANADTKDEVDDKLLLECVFLLGAVAALDSLLLVVLLHGELRSLGHRMEMRRKMSHWEEKREDARRRLRAAKQDLIHRRFVWKNREKRLEAIKEAMLRREEALHSPVQEEDKTLRATIDRTLSNASRLRLVS
jgi:hypothetical protein